MMKIDPGLGIKGFILERCNKIAVKNRCLILSD